MDGDARALRNVAEEQDETKQQAHAAIARAHNAVLTGTSGYPDATFTLKLAVPRGQDCRGRRQTGPALHHASPDYMRAPKK